MTLPIRKQPPPAYSYPSHRFTAVPARLSPAEGALFTFCANLCLALSSPCLTTRSTSPYVPVCGGRSKRRNVEQEKRLFSYRRESPARGNVPRCSGHEDGVCEQIQGDGYSPIPLVYKKRHFFFESDLSDRPEPDARSQIAHTMVNFIAIESCESSESHISSDRKIVDNVYSSCCFVTDRHFCAVALDIEVLWMCL